MTISTTITKNSYVGDASTTEFTYAFKISDEDHIQVIIKVTATGAETENTPPTPAPPDNELEPLGEDETDDLPF